MSATLAAVARRLDGLPCVGLYRHSEQDIGRPDDAKGVGSDDVANVAQNHLRNYARAVQKINHVIPDVVVAELADEEGFTSNGVAKKTRKMVDEAWKSTDQSGMKTS